MSQANDYFFARKREIFFGLFFSRVSAKFFFGGIFLVFLVFFCVLGVFAFVFRALARIFLGFIFRDEPSKAGNLCPASSVAGWHRQVFFLI